MLSHQLSKGEAMIYFKVSRSAPKAITLPNIPCPCIGSDAHASRIRRIVFLAMSRILFLLVVAIVVVLVARIVIGVAISIAVTVTVAITIAIAVSVAVFPF